MNSPFVYGTLYGALCPAVNNKEQTIFLGGLIVEPIQDLNLRLGIQTWIKPFQGSDPSFVRRNYDIDLFLQSYKNMN